MSPKPSLHGHASYTFSFRHIHPSLCTPCHCCSAVFCFVSLSLSLSLSAEHVGCCEASGGCFQPSFLNCCYTFAVSEVLSAGARHKHRAGSAGFGWKHCQPDEPLYASVIESMSSKGECSNKAGLILGPP